MEFAINENSAVVGIPLVDIELKDNLLIGCIHRHGEIMIPRGHDMIQVGDTVIVVTTQKCLHDIEDILKK